MSEGFANPIVGGGGALVYPSIHSPNFDIAAPASSPTPSWAILKNGLAYVFGLIVTGGTITGPDYIINSSGAFWYTGAPAVGNLSISIVPGTVNVNDPPGNTVLPGLTLYNDGTPAINTNPANGDLNLLNNLAGFTSGTLTGLPFGLTEAGVWLTGPACNTAGLDDVTSLQLLSSNGAASGAAANLYYTDPAGVTHTYFKDSCAGAVISAGAVTATLPGTGLSPANPAAAEVWHAVSLTGGPAGIAGYARVKKLAEADLMMIDLQISFTTLAANSTTTIGTLPALYYPATARNVPAGVGGTVTNANPPRLFVPASGGLQLILPVGANSMGVQACIPLD